MRFAYIDSQGNEVPIPSVDALALRIELGAISPETQLYDEQADYWGPAESHEIFHTLSRAKDEEGFVAPPPVVPPPPHGGSAADTTAEEPAAPPAETVSETPAPSAEGGTGAPGESETAGSPGQPSSIFDLAEENTPATDAGTVKEEAAAAPEDEDFDLGDIVAESPAASKEPEEAGFGLDLGGQGEDSLGGLTPEPAAADEEGGFDFGDTGTLELEEPAGADADASPALGGGMELEQPLSDVMDFSSADGAADDSGLELDSAMSEFGGDSPPAWMEQEGPGPAQGEDTDSATLDESPPFSDQPGDIEGEHPQRQRREPVSRPSPPRRPKQSRAPAVFGTIVVVAVVGAGGFLGWKAVSGGAGRTDPGEDVPSLPPVVIPDIPAELLPVMRDLAEDALADMMAELRGMQSEFDIAPEPRSDWLSGSYLGTASTFADVEEYWLGIEAYVDRIRSVDREVFHDMYVARVEAAGIAADTAALLVERADSGFLAARDGRLEAYRQMDDLINAALDLHMFLVDNEADIAYEPAAGGISRDPVLEAIPSNSALGDEMWGMVDNITDALDSLGTLDRVTTERLFAVLFDRIRRAGVQ